MIDPAGILSDEAATVADALRGSDFDLLEKVALALYPADEMLQDRFLEFGGFSYS